VSGAGTDARRGDPGHMSCLLRLSTTWSATKHRLRHVAAIGVQ
jgi:hypothetical protein